MSIENDRSANRQVITIATGKQLYLDMAVNLARSFFYWHVESDIKFQIVTDLPEKLPLDVNQKAHVISVKPGELGQGFSTKLNLDKLVSYGQTLFIDSDCLVFENIENLFDRFKGHKVSVVGGYISEGEWFGDVKHVCSQFNINHLPKFNGGLYYIEKGTEATQVYETARQLEQRYDEIGFVKLRNQPNDEVLMALAMQLHGQVPLEDDGRVMTDPQACRGGYYVNVLSGKRWLINPPAGNKKHQSWYPFQKVSPAIVHFLGYYTKHYLYRREAYKLKILAQQKSPILANLKSLTLIQFPQQIINGMKNILRPVYRLVFGFRKIKQSDRIL